MAPFARQVLGAGGGPQMTKSRKLVVFTDLDGTLLDHRTYSFEEASPALDRIRLAGVPLVLCSSKTRPEIECVRRQLNSLHPFIAENGAAVYIPPRYFPFAVAGARAREGYLVLECGRPYREVVALLHRTAARLNVAVVGFSDMSVAEVAEACGLPLAEARLARAREYDEPFCVVAGGSAARARLCRGLRRVGIRCVAGGRFDHATGSADKGTSVARLIVLYRRVDRRVLTVGLGDSLNDLPLLSKVDLPVIVRNPAARSTAQLRGALPAARVTRGAGPAGWAEAVNGILGEHGIGRARPQPGGREGHERRGRRRTTGRVRHV